MFGDSVYILVKELVKLQGGPRFPLFGDTLYDLSKKLLNNQSGARASSFGDTLYDIWKKILINQEGQYTFAFGDTLQNIIQKVAANVGYQRLPNDPVWYPLRFLVQAGGIQPTPPPDPLHPDVQDYRDRILANSGVVSGSQLTALSDFVFDLEDTQPALYTILKAGRFNPFLGTPAATGALNAAMVPLYAGVGPSLDVPTALVDADVGSLGIAGNGSTKFVSLATNNNVFAQNNQALGVFVTAAQTTNATYFGAGAGNAGASVITTNGTDTLGTRSQSSASDNDNNVTAATASGLFAIRRDNSANYQRIWGNVIDSQTITRASQTPRSDTLCVLRGGLDSGFFSNGTVGAYFACAGTGWSLMTLRPLMNTLMQSLGRFTP